MKPNDNPEPHLEGGDECWWKKIRVTPEFMEMMASRTLEGYRVHWHWHGPDSEGLWTPLATIDFDDAAVPQLAEGHD